MKAILLNGKSVRFPERLETVGFAVEQTTHQSSKQEKFKSFGDVSLKRAALIFPI